MGELITMKSHVQKLNSEPKLTEAKLRKYLDRLNTRVVDGVAEPAEVDILRYLTDYAGESRLTLGN